MNINKIVIYISSITIISLAIWSCANDRIPATYEQIGICFETEILPIAVSNCTQSTCHNPVDLTAGYDFTTYEGISAAVKPFKPNKSKFYEYLIVSDPNGIMPPPPNSPLSSEQISLIKEWIEKGAPNTNNCFTSCDTLAGVSFNTQVLPLLNTYCNGCHSGNTPEGGIDQSNWSAVKITVDNGSFLGSIRHDMGFSAMPLNGAKMNSCDILLIETWVNEGALDN